MPELALSMIVKNEEENLPRLLESVKGIFDELIIVDTGSTDRTKEVAFSYGAKVYDFEWVKHFAKARNFSLSKVTKPWWMWLDADDVLTPSDREMLLALKTTLGAADAYLMNYNYAQNEMGDPICRFFRHRILRTASKIHWNGRIHEHLVIIPGTKEAMTNVVVTHKRSAKANEQDKGRNIALLELAVEEEPGNQRLKFYYGKELYSEGKHEKSIQVLEEYLKGTDWHDNRVNAWYWVAMAHWAMGKTDLAISACMKGIELDPRWAEFFYIVGQIYMDRSDWGRAIQWLEIAASCPVPETWGTVILDNYTWVPRDRLCMCNSKIGNFQKAYEWNEDALRYRPSDERLLFNRNFLRDQLFDRLAARPLRLNLGSGGKPTSGWRNCDLYQGPGVELRIDQRHLPYRDGVGHAIRSEHALEHSASHYSAEDTVREWARFLRYGGTLDLYVPDLDQCCQAFVTQEDRPRRPDERWTPKEWYKYTIYGIQKSQGAEPPDGQYHRTGFTKEQLRRLLSENGFLVEKLENYDGWGTPSIHVEAMQLKKKVRVAWLLRGTDPNDPSTRIRRLNVNAMFKDHPEISSTIIPGYHGRDEGALHALVRDYDVVVFTMLSDLERKVMDRLRASGVTTVIDYNEDLEEYPGIVPCLESASLIVCCSTELAKKASKYGRTAYIPDAYETPEGKVDSHREADGPRAQVLEASR